MRTSKDLPVPPSTAPRRAVVTLVAVALAAIYLTGRLLPALGHDGHRAVRWWGAVALYVAAAGLCLWRARTLEGDRRTWTLIGIGMLAYAVGSVISIVSDRPSDDPPLVAIVLWLSFAVLTYTALLLMLRARLRPFSLSFCLDGILGGLTLAAVAAVLVRHQVDGIATTTLVTGLALPVADLVLLSILLWASAMSGWRGATWLWLAAAMAMAAIGDVTQDLSIARDTYDELSLTTALFPLSLLTIGVAAWQPMPPSRRIRPDTLAILALPLLSLAAVVWVLVVVDADDGIALALALAALAVGIARALLTFREVGRLHEARRFARGFEEAAIGMAFVDAATGRYTRVNAALAAMFGRPAAEIVGGRVGAFNAPHQDEASAQLQRVLASGRAPEPFVRRIEQPGGTIVDLAVSVAVVEDDDGVPQLF